MIRYIYPGSGPVEPLDLYLGEARSHPDRPWVLLNMIASVDGATSLGGKSTALGDQDDLAVFKALRAVPNVILVGAGTARAENYGPVRLDAERIARRRELGLEDVPRLAVVTGRASLDPEARLFSDSDQRPLVITSTAADPERVSALEEVADVVRLDSLDAVSILRALGGAKVVLCEGGPSLNGQLAAAGLVDEINLTVAPVIVSGESARIVHGEEADPPADMTLDRILMGDRVLFLRYLRSAD
ncbi:MAG: dihydrofolate reductase family protein [Acidimicrobiia bacterium]